MSDVLIYDIETKTFGAPDPNKDVMRLFGCYSFKTEKYYLLTNKDDIQRIINAHKHLVGFNNLEYDNPIILRAGIDLKYKIFIDLMQIFKTRASQMKIDKGMLGDLLISYSLDYITKMLELVDKDTGKKEIDYSLFQKDVWTQEELKTITEYTKRDLEVTKKLYEWVESYFEGFKPFLNEEDVNKKVYLSSTIAKFAYKAICKEMNWTEEYGQGNFDEGDNIKGGYVAYPAGERFDNDIYLFDFASLYPHVMMQCNLHDRHKLGETNRPKWNGDNKWKVEGQYYSDEMGGVGKLLKRWFHDRKEFKFKGDRREYTIKIILNAIYGILDDPYYLRVYDKIAAGDCTRIGRQWIQYARKVYRDHGYINCYTDTDSLYIKDPFKDKDKVLALKEKIINDIKCTVPFPQDTFTMELEYEIKYLYFFKGGNKEESKLDELDPDDFLNKSLGFMKKNYIFVSTNDKLVIKNLGIRKKSNSPLSQKIFWEHLVPQIKEGTIKFNKTFINNVMLKLLEENYSLAAMRKDVGNYEQYKEKSPNSIQAQIAQKYGAGIHFLLPNLKNIGVGKGKSYCTLEEFKQHQLKIGDIDLENVWSELEYFIKPVVSKNIFQF